MSGLLLSKLIVQWAIGVFCIILGGAFGLHFHDKLLLYMSVIIGICCFLRCFLLYRLIRTNSYQTLEGLCIKRNYSLLKKTQQVTFKDKNECEHQFMLDKRVKLLIGHRYRLYFRLPSHTSSNTEDISQSLQNYLGIEELSSTIPVK
ncbi:hypothetical protein BLCOC_07110 [Blautia coccoides]|jgi:hypothetical protein|uniref:YcxB-like protein n=1 Tax=Blautia producta TaxID=33035 RepID=A0ABZ0U8K9_9FIRM|nr:hypothetical protein EV205_14616 [Blautia coccoides]WPX72375.1 hypothetical protein BLCOC_07110 [Blautia coccoides]SUY05819.1 Uncharacterised protein [Blautia coccoides]